MCTETQRHLVQGNIRLLLQEKKNDKNASGGTERCLEKIDDKNCLLVQQELFHCRGDQVSRHSPKQAPRLMKL